jgi:hypothetical protein
MNKSEQNRRDYLKRKQDGGTITVDERSELKGLQDRGKASSLRAVAKASNKAKLKGAVAWASKQNERSRWQEFADRLRSIAKGD